MTHFHTLFSGNIKTKELDDLKKIIYEQLDPENTNINKLALFFTKLFKNLKNGDEIIPLLFELFHDNIYTYPIIFKDGFKDDYESNICGNMINCFEPVAEKYKKKIKRENRKHELKLENTRRINLLNSDNKNKLIKFLNTQIGFKYYNWQSTKIRKNTQFTYDLNTQKGPTRNTINTRYTRNTRNTRYTRNTRKNTRPRP
jgi:hypothetical protein